MIRSLTEEELEQIKAAKQVVKDKVTSLREKLKKERKQLSTNARKDLENQISYIALPIGKPVILVVDGSEIIVDYDLLAKFLKLLDKQKFLYTLRVQGPEYDRKLEIHYHQGTFSRDTRGTAALLELPPRRRDLLQGLPKIEIAI